MARSEHKRIVDLWRGRGERAELVRSGFRSDGKPRAAKKPCGCVVGCCLKCRPKKHAGYYTDAEVQTFWEAYQTSPSAAAVERQFGLPVKGLKDILERRGFLVRPPKVTPRLGFGVRLPEPTEAEISAAIAKLKFVNVPPELKIQWKRWSMAKRQKFVRRIRATLKLKTDRPTKPFSANVTPWEYGTPAAMEIARKMNAGRNSQTKLVSIRAGSQGVIWNGQLWFWTAKADGTPYGYQGGRPKKLLNRAIWEQTHGQPVPDKHIVSYKDGNLNNLAPENLQLLSMAQNALRNSVPVRLKSDPSNPVLLEKLRLRGERTSATRAVTMARKSRALTAVALQSHQNPGGLMAALSRRNV